LLFFVRNTRMHNSKVPIYLRVTVNGKRAEISANRKVPVALWNSSAGKASGNTNEAHLINRYLNKIENEIYKCYQKLLDQNEPFTAKQVINLYSGKKEKHKMLLEIFQEHNDKVNRLIGQDFAAG